MGLREGNEQRQEMFGINYKETQHPERACGLFEHLLGTGSFLLWEMKGTEKTQKQENSCKVWLCSVTKLHWFYADIFIPIISLTFSKIAGIKSYSSVPPILLKNIYHSAIENIFSYCMTVCYASCTASDLRELQCVVKTAQRISGVELSSLTELYTSRLQRRTRCILLPIQPIQVTSSLNCFHLLDSTGRYKFVQRGWEIASYQER